MSINNKFNLGDHVILKTSDTNIPWMHGEVVEIRAKVMSEYGKHREIYYRIRPDGGKGSGFHCTYPEDQWENKPTTESKDQP